MPVYRGPDGKIIEERTTRLEKGKSPGYGEPDTLQQPGVKSVDAARTATSTSIESATEVAGKGAIKPAGSADEQSEFDAGDKTMIYRPKRTTENDGKNASPNEDIDFMDDPLAGWLVVIDGPGKGASLNLGYGSNSIGRSKSERVSMDFGDKLISRNGHALVTYDPRGKRFFIQGGGGSNLTYIGEEVVLAPRELKAFDTIVIGNTSLRFVPLCGADFDWQEESKEE